MDLARKQLFLLDLDGVLIKGKERPVKIGGTRLIQRIRETGRKVFLLTNNSTDTTETVHSKLVDLDIPIREDEILTSARLTAEYVSKKYGQARYHLIGEKGLQLELDALGLTRADGLNAKVVVVGLDRMLTYLKMNDAVEVARGGADIVATHSARLYMAKDGPAIAVGPILKALEYAAGKRGVAIGKPSPHMFLIALEKAGCRKKDAVMIGDQEDTDIDGASRAGIDSVLVLSGVADRKDKTKAKIKVENVDALAEII